MLLKRIITVVIGAPFVIGAIVCPLTWVFKIFAAACLAVALFEFFTVTALAGFERLFAVAVGGGHLLFLLFCPSYEKWLLLEMTALVLVVLVFYCMAPKASAEGMAAKAAFMVLGAFYIGTFGAFVGLLRELEYGVFWVFALLAMTWLNDTFAYFFGHKFGRKKLAPLISPGKTWEGFFGGMLGTAVGFFAFWLLIPNDVSLAQGFFLIPLVGIFGPLGDLCESLIKRHFHVKDSGNVIPGHGGMLDRIDALLFTAPIVYFFAALTG